MGEMLHNILGHNLYSTQYHSGTGTARVAVCFNYIFISG